MRQIVKNERAITDLFDSIKSDRFCRKQLLFSFLRFMPKVELHSHLTGAVYGEHYWDLALKIGLFF